MKYFSSFPSLARAGYKVFFTAQFLALALQLFIKMQIFPYIGYAFMLMTRLTRVDKSLRASDKSPTVFHSRRGTLLAEWHFNWFPESPNDSRFQVGEFFTWITAMDLRRCNVRWKLIASECRNVMSALGARINSCGALKQRLCAARVAESKQWVVSFHSIKSLSPNLA